MAKRVVGRRRRRRIRKALMKAFLCFVLLCFLLSAGAIYYVISTSAPINPSDIYSSIAQTSSIYDTDGNLIDTLYFEEDRKIVESAGIPKDLKNAVIAIEDKTFYTHRGFNFKRMAGAVIYKLLGRTSEISGTSTITQQLARNVYLSDTKSERTIKRKATEMWYALQIENALSKEEILEAYLNSIYLGYGCYGVQSAAKTYFSKDVSELSLVECAALAALPQAPDAYALVCDEEVEGCTKIEGVDAYANDASKERRDLVLDLMAEQGYISNEDASSSKVDISAVLNPSFGTRSSIYTYFADYVAGAVVKDLEVEKGMTRDEAERLLYTGGLQINSTISPKAQKIVSKAFKDDANFPDCVDGKTEPEAAMVIAEVGTGKVVAMAGGRSGSGKKLFNRATSPRQPGSSIKPLSVYSAALQKSFDLEKEGKKFQYTDFGSDRQGVKYWGDYITASSYVADEKMTLGGKTWPLNATRTFSGRQTFRTALQKSINTCAVKIQRQVGDEYSMAMLKKYGISTLQDDTTQPVNDQNAAALSLGAMTYGATPLDMALAYGTFPGGGIRREPVCYTTVTDAEGNVVLEKEAATSKVLDEGVAWIMTDVLQSAVSRGIASDAAISGTEVGGKTGTTNDNYDIWFCGFTPKYSAALWIGTDKNIEMNALSSRAAWLWSDIMSSVPGSTEGEYRDAPSNIVTIGGEYYTKGTEVGRSSYRGSSKSQRNSGSSSSSSSGSSSGYSRDDFVRDFTGGGGGGSSSGSSSRSSSGSSSSSGNAREDWIKEWQNSN